MKVLFSDRPAYYFIKKYVDEHFDLDGIAWSTFLVPEVYPGCFKDQKSMSNFQNNLCDTLKDIPEERMIICFSLCDFGDYFSFLMFYEVYSELKRQGSYKDAVLVVGGTVLNYLDLEQMVDRFIDLDCIVIGPGERIYGELLTQLSKGKSLERICYGAGADRTGFPDVSITRSENLYGQSFGNMYLCSWSMDKCYWGKCKFCHHMKPDVIKKESIKEFCDRLISIHLNDGIENFLIYDNAMTAANLEILLKSLAKNGLNGMINIYLFGARLERTYLDIVPLVREVDVIRRINWGLESFSQRILTRYAKGTRVSTFEPILKSYSELGIGNLIYILLGLPLMETEDIEKTAAGIKALRSYYTHISVNWFIMSDGIDVFNKPESYDIVIKDKFNISESIGMSGLGDYDISTRIYDFDATIDGKLLTRRQDFQRYKPLLKGLNNDRVPWGFSCYFLG